MALSQRGLIKGFQPDAQTLASELSNVSTFISINLPTPVDLPVGFTNNELISYLINESAASPNDITEGYVQSPWAYIFDKNGNKFNKFFNNNIIEFPATNQAWNFRLVLFGEMSGGNNHRGKVVFYVPTAPNSGIVEEELQTEYIGGFAPDLQASSFAASLTTRVSPFGNILAHGIGIKYEQQDGNFRVDRVTILIGN